ncbi:unnamed protein product [Paramecium sonneborni]|uniref:Uncharacterized protein n=1 Tax=Paramecium sonneborni TaxID=65129 RepID=A0A8S1L4V4_9CILI|nr:unnamed protein product [Paramecium sonneborni]
MPNIKQYKSDSQIPQLSTFTILCKISPINPPDTPREIQTLKLQSDQQDRKQVQANSKSTLRQDDSIIRKNDNNYSMKLKRRKPILVIRHSKSLQCIKKEKSVRFLLDKDQSSFQFYILHNNYIQKGKKNLVENCSLKQIDEDVSPSNNGAKKLFEKIHKKYESKVHF